MTKILAIDSSTATCSVAIFSDHRIMAHSISQDAYKHAGLLAQQIQEICHSNNVELAELNAVAVSIGPGSFTGLRVGLSTAKGLCYAHNLPLIAISTLDALVYGAIDKGISTAGVWMPMIDARRMEVYTSIYDPSLHIIKEAHPLILDNETVSELVSAYGHITAMGDGASKIRTLSPVPDIQVFDLHMHATFMCKPAFIKYERQDYADTAYTTPFYLKPPNITRPNRTKL